MEYKKQDKKLFEKLHQATTGDQLIDYLNRLTQHLCDVRNIDDNMDIEAAKHAADMLEEYVIDKVEKRTETKDNALGELSQQME